MSLRGSEWQPHWSGLSWSASDSSKLRTHSQTSRVVVVLDVVVKLVVVDSVVVLAAVAPTQIAS